MELSIEFLLISFFSIAIVDITIQSMIKVFTIAVERNELSKQKYRFLVISSIAIGLSIATALPFGYYKLFETIL